MARRPACAADIAAAVAQAAVTLNRYPDREFVDLRMALASYSVTASPTTRCGRPTGPTR